MCKHETIEQAKTVFYLANNKKEIVIDANIDFERPDVLLLVKIAQGEIKDGFTARSVYKSEWKGLNIARTKVGLSVLVEAGILVTEFIGRDGKPGRPKTIYWFSPLLVRLNGVTP